MGFDVIGTGSALPELVVTNEDLTRFLDTSDEWITSRTGIGERRLIGKETLLDLSVSAARRAMDNAKVSAGDIDMIIFSSLQGEYISPSSSCLMAAELGISCDYVMDINMACSGFLYALDLADTYITAGKANRVLIVCAEEMSKLIDWTDRSVCVLFGDGAGAAVLEKGDSLRAITFKHSGDARILNVGACPGNSPYKAGGRAGAFLSMDGQEVFMFAVSSIIKDIREILAQTKVSPSDISFYLLHQANMRILQTVQKKLKLPQDKFPHNIERRGNTSSASIPILLDELNKDGRLRDGDLLLLSSFGAGMTSAAALIAWRK